jgi:hypothetical protein
MKGISLSVFGSGRLTKRLCALTVLALCLCQTLLGISSALPIKGQLLGQTKMPNDRPKYFFIDTKGRAVIDASKYEAALDFSEGLAAVRDGRGWGFIDKDGKETIEPRFSAAMGFSEGLAPVQIGTLWGFIDRHGRIVIQPQYELVNPFSEGIAVVVKAEDKSETKAILNGLQVVPQSRLIRRKHVLVGGPLDSPPSENREALLIDSSGNVVLRLRPKQVSVNINGRFSEGLIEAYDPLTQKYGFIDKRGTFVIEPKYLQVARFSEGLSRVAVIEDGEEKLGFIDHSGRFVIQPQFNTDADFFRNSTDFSEELASVTENLRPTVTEAEKFVYISRVGEITLFTDFSYAGPFRKGLALVYDARTEKWGYIDKLGRLAIPPRFHLAGNFSEGLASVAIQNK